jgi:hypothetical protein
VNYHNLEKLMKKDRNESNYVTIPKYVLRRLLSSALKSKNLFDERFYLETYPDIAAAIRSKKVKSALDHYLDTGYYENRMPRKLIVDERYYLQENPDVAAAIKKGRLKNAQEHFNQGGFMEGRLPFKDFALF